MAIADPQGFTVGGEDIWLPRIPAGEGRGLFREETGTLEFRIDHSYGRRNRRAIRLNHNKVAVDPLVSTLNVPYSMSATLVVDTPKVGYTVAEAADIGVALMDTLKAADAALLIKILGGQA